MELFSFRTVGEASGKGELFFWICVAVAAAVLLISTITAIVRSRDRYYRIHTGAVARFFKGLLRLILTVAISVAALAFGGFLLVSDHATVEKYAQYQALYESGDYLCVSGRVEDFCPATHSKSFVIDGVKFTVRPQSEALKRREHGDFSSLLYYTYREQRVFFTYNAMIDSMVTHYEPETCVILGDGQQLEIHYIVENGENRILYIKELSES